jgi:protein-L-isoaspartate(D-aspartate) O-methyltransferase
MLDALKRAPGHHLHLIASPLAGGAPQHAPYTVILVEGTVQTFPPPLLEQLAEGGRLVAVRMDAPPVAHIVTVTRAGARFDACSGAEAFAPLLPGFVKPSTFEL